MSPLTWAVAAAVVHDRGRVLLCRQDGPGRRWSLPGGRLHRPEDPAYVVTRRIRSATGLEITVVDLLGLYRLAGPDPDVLVHVFRAHPIGETRADHPSGPDPAGSPPDGTRREFGDRPRRGWYDPNHPPESLTPVTRATLVALRAGHSGVVCRLPHELPGRAARPTSGTVPGARTAVSDGTTPTGPVAG